MEHIDELDYNKLYKKSFSFAKYYLHDVMKAEDIASDSIITLLRLMKQTEVKHIEALLLTITRNKALNVLKHESIRHSVEKGLSDIGKRELSLRISTLEACDPQGIFLEEISEIIRKTLASLPQRTQDIFKMSRMDLLSVKDIAEKTSLTSKGVEYHITKALQLLRVELKDYLPLLPFLFTINQNNNFFS